MGQVALMAVAGAGLQLKDTLQISRQSPFYSPKSIKAGAVDLPLCLFARSSVS